MQQLYFGTPQRRIDGRAKVTGAATYAGEFSAPDLAHGTIVSSAITRGRITRIDTEAALAIPGVIKIYTHENRPATAWFDSKYQDEVAPPGSPFRALNGDRIMYGGQPVALVVAADFATARHAASLIHVEYDSQDPVTDLESERDRAYVPKEKRNGISPPPEPRGDAAAAFQAAPLKIEAEYRIADEHHNPMEPHATTVVFGGGKTITVHDKIQGVMNSLEYVTEVFGLSPDDVHVVAPYVGGAFGSGLRPQYQLFLAVMASLDLKRSVRVALTRDQMFSFTYRPGAIMKVALGADENGKLRSIRHEAIAGTSRFEDYQEVVVNWSGLLYRCDNVALDYKLVQLDKYTPGDMRAPGAPTGLFALESAMDELAYRARIDPVELRLLNYADKDENEDKPITSKELRAAYQQGAEKFGWWQRPASPRSMRDGRELVGWGMATGAWEAMMMPTSARAVLTEDGRLEVASATADIGTGTYTILAQIAADEMGVPIEHVTVKIGDSRLPKSPLEGGSWAAASAGSAVRAACIAVREKLFALARGMANSPLANLDMGQMVISEGRIAAAWDASRAVTFADAIRAGKTDRIEAEETVGREKDVAENYSAYTHSAVFVEVKVDEELGVVRVTRVVDAIAAGKIINPKTARSQIIGGVVFGIGMALREESMIDHHLGRIMNHNLAEYHLPVNADIPDIEVIFVDEEDDKVNAMGVKGLGEIGVVGTAAAIANAIFHATGKRVRDLPITLDKVFA